jgi:hypothetical protein
MGDWPIGIDPADADVAVGEVKASKTFYAGTEPKKTGTMPTVALDSGSSAYPAGYHAGNVGGLPAIDADLVTGSIKSGVTIFNVAGSTDVRDSTDADAAVGNVLDPKTFYAGGGAKKTGTMPTVAIVAANDDYPAGYHAGDAGGLDAIDTDLASANIKSGITIFGKAGAATVQDIADADLTIAEVPTGKKFYAVTGGVKTGTGTKALDPANDTVAAGYYAVTTLHAVDADLAVGNIATNKTVFGFAGTYDTSATPIAAARMKTGDEGWVNGSKITGTGTKTLDPANSTVNAGYYAATTLQAVDADLAVGNIKTGVNIFGFVGTYDTSATPIAAARMKTGDEGWVNGSKITGTGTKTLDPANSTVNAGYYAATTLEAVDADLVVGNIKSGVTIFGKLGTYLSTPTFDTEYSNYSLLSHTTGTYSIYYLTSSIAASSDLYIIITLQVHAASVALGFGQAVVKAVTANTIKISLYLASVQLAESAYVTTLYLVIVPLQGYLTLPAGTYYGTLLARNYDSVYARSVTMLGASLNSGNPGVACLFFGSVKVVT